MQSRFIKYFLIFLALTVVLPAVRSYGYDWEVGDEFEITSGTIRLFSSLGDIETCLRSSVADPLEGLNSPLAKRAQEIFHYQTEKIGKGTKINLVDWAVLRITVKPLTCYRANATKSNYKTTGWFVDVNGPGAWNDYSAEPSAGVNRRWEKERSKSASLLGTLSDNWYDLTENERIDYIRNYKVPGETATVSDVLNEVITNWRARGRRVVIEGWRDEGIYQREDVRESLGHIHFDMWLFLDIESVSEYLKPVLWRHGINGIFSNIKGIKALFSWSLNHSEGPKGIAISCRYWFLINPNSMKIVIACMQKKPVSSVSTGVNDETTNLPPFKNPSELIIEADSAFWPLSDKNYGFPRDVYPREIINEFKKYSGLYYCYSGMSKEADQELERVFGFSELSMVSEPPDQVLERLKYRDKISCRSKYYDPSNAKITDRGYNETGEPEDCVTVRTYDKNGRLILRERISEGARTDKEIECVYNERGDLKSYRNWNGTWVFTYDSNGLIIKANFFNPEGNPAVDEYVLKAHVCEWVYSPNGRFINELRLGARREELGKDVLELW